MYIVDSLNHRIRKVTISTGIISTIAGTGTSSYSGDNGPATAAALNNPYGIALDTAGKLLRDILLSDGLISFAHLGNVYAADTDNNRIRKVTISTGIIATIAGCSTSGSYSGDGGQATAATLYKPHGVAVDSPGNSLF